MKNKDIPAHKLQKHYIDLNGSSEGISKNIQNRMHRYVNIAKALYRKGCISNGRTFNVSFGVYRDKVLAIGINDYSKIMPEYSRQLNLKYKRYGEKSYIPCIHSEMSCLLKLGADNCDGISVYNVRIDKNGHCKNSQPCHNCYAALMQMNVKHIYYYDDNMNICCI